MKQYVTASHDETAALGEALGQCLRPGDSVLLQGQLGAGKSVLARSIAHALGVEGPMASPTFTLMQPYEGRVPVHHFDLYRLEDEDEFFAAGLSDYVGGDAVALIEWPLEDMDCAPALRIELERGESEDRRVLTLRFEGFEEARVAQVESVLARWEA